MEEFLKTEQIHFDIGYRRESLLLWAPNNSSYKTSFSVPYILNKLEPVKLKFSMPDSHSDLCSDTFYPQMFSHPAKTAIEKTLGCSIENLQKSFLREADVHLTLELY